MKYYIRFQFPVCLLFLYLIFLNCEVYREPQNNNVNNTQGEIIKSELPLSSVVLILCYSDNSNYVSSGSGSIISSNGNILTNYHVIANSITSNSAIIAGMNNMNPEDEPNVYYKCTIIKIDETNDLALLKITHTKDGEEIPSNSNFTPVTIGNSDKLKLGDEIVILGYPGIGRFTITLTKGSISGWINDGTIYKGWIKTDAEINKGNSGGLAINKENELIGVPTAIFSDKLSLGKIGLIRPIEKVKLFISNN